MDKINDQLTAIKVLKKISLKSPKNSSSPRRDPWSQRYYFTSQISLVSSSSAKVWYFLAAFTSSICAVTQSS